MSNFGDDFIEKIWSAILEKQQSINRQLEVSAEKITRDMEKSSRLIEESEKKYLLRIDKKNLELKELDRKINKQLEDNKIIFEDNSCEPAVEKEQKKSKKRLKKTKNNKNKEIIETEKISEASVEMAKHPVFIAILKHFNDSGYHFDDITLEKYWKLVNSTSSS